MQLLNLQDDACGMQLMDYESPSVSLSDDDSEEPYSSDDSSDEKALSWQQAEIDHAATEEAETFPPENWHDFFFEPLDEDKRECIPDQASQDCIVEGSFHRLRKPIEGSAGIYKGYRLIGVQFFYFKSNDN